MMKETIAVEQLPPETRLDVGDWLARELPLLNIPKGYGPALVTAYLYGFLPRMMVVAALAGLRPLLQRGPLIDEPFAKPRADFFKNFKCTSGLEAQLKLYDIMIEQDKLRKLAKLNAQLQLNIDGFHHSFNLLANLKGLTQYLQLDIKQKSTATMEEIAFALLTGMPGLLIVKRDDGNWYEPHTGRSCDLSGDEHCSRNGDLILVTRQQWMTDTELRVTEAIPVTLGLLQNAQPSRLQVQHSDYRYRPREVICLQTWTFNGHIVSRNPKAPAPSGPEAQLAICSAVLEGAEIEGAQELYQLQVKLKEMSQSPDPRTRLYPVHPLDVHALLTSLLGEHYVLEDLRRLPPLSPDNLALLTKVRDAADKLLRYRSRLPEQVTIDGITCPVSYRHEQGLQITVHLGRNYQALFSSVDLGLPFYGLGSIDIELEVPGKQPGVFERDCFSIDHLGLDQIRMMAAGYMHYVPGPLDYNSTLHELIKKVEVPQPPVSGMQRNPLCIWLAVGSPMTYNTPQQAHAAAAAAVKQWLIDEIISHWYPRSMLGEPLHERLANRLAESLLSRLDNREVQLHQAPQIFAEHYSRPLSDAFWVAERNNAETKLAELSAALDGIQSSREDNARVRNLRSAALRALDNQEIPRAANYLEHAHDALLFLHQSRSERPEPKKKR